MLRDVLDLLAPARCLSCRARATPPWCADCHDDVTAYRPGCRRCGWPDRRLGHPCWPPGAPFAATTVAFDYRGPVARAVVTAKVGGAWSAWPLLGELLADRLALDPPDVDVVTWVTTPPHRARRRGVDHARALAEVAAKRLDLPLLRLLDATPSTRGDRYACRVALPGTQVLLVDDVLTTGRTAARAGRTLLDAGGDRVHLAVLARAGTAPLTDGAVR